MSQSTVCAILLTADRPELARKAVAAFRAQTYPAKRLLILDSGTDDFSESDDPDGDVFWTTTMSHGGDRLHRKTIGELRNEAAAFWTEFPILIHWDDDDWSHPNRIAEQVALLQSSGADVVGYNEMLFWRESRAGKSIPDPRTPHFPRPTMEPGEAWLYTNPNPGYALGTSLCYWRKTWERKPFEATSRGEDLQFITGLKCVGESSVRHYPDKSPVTAHDYAPRMIARIHGGNTSTAYDPKKMVGPEWRRVPEWDAYARSVME